MTTDLYAKAHSSEVEGAVLSVVLDGRHKASWASLIESCPTPDYFYVVNNRLIAMACAYLFSHGMAIDATTVVAHLQTVRNGDAVIALRELNGLRPVPGLDFGESVLATRGGSEMVFSVMAQAGNVSGFKQNVDTLKAYWRQRRGIAILDSALQLAAAADGSRKIQAIGDTVINGVAHLLGGAVSTSDIGGAAMTALAEHDRAALGGERRIPTWGLRELDVLAKLVPGTMTVLSANPGGGKTSMALQAAMATVKLLGPSSAAIVSMEMSGPELAEKLIACEVGTTTENIQDGLLTAEQRVDAENAANRWINDDIGLKGTSSRGNVMDICAWTKLRHMRSGGKLALLVVDYLGLIAATNTRHSEYEMISHATAELKQLALSLRISVLLLAQMSRDDRRAMRDDNGNVTGYPEPRLSGLKGSGSIESDADCVVFLWKQKDFQIAVYPVEAIVAKQRRGPLGRVSLEFMAASGQVFRRAESPAAPERHVVRDQYQPRGGVDIL